MASDKQPPDLMDMRGVQDPGNINMMFFPHNGRVVQRLDRKTDVIMFDPVNAAELGAQLFDLAEMLGVKVSLKVEKRKITDEQRAQMILRTGHIMRSELEKNRNPEMISRAIVDSILSAID